MSIENESLIVAMHTVAELGTGTPVYVTESGKCGVAMAHCPENPMKHEVMGLLNGMRFLVRPFPSS